MSQIVGVILGILMLFIAQGLQPGDEVMGNLSNDEESSARTAWVNSRFDSMSLDEQIGQLLIIRAHSDLGPDHVKGVEDAIKNYHVGGLCFFQGTPEKQLELTNWYQSISEIPLLVSVDAEWGLGMRLKENAMSFPHQLTLGAITDDKLIYQMGLEIGHQLRRLGIHMNYAPVVDVNNNYLNPVINDRSFGEDRVRVAKKGYLYMLGMQDANVLACAKHFPGHGDTDVDSHYDLPQINHDRQRLDSIELFPFRLLAQQGVSAMMVAHLNIPAIIEDPELPTTLSRAAVTDLLKEELGFEGLIITDGMEMEGVTKYHGPGEAEAKAIAAGNDLICLPRDVAKAHEAIKKYVEDGRIPRTQLEASVKKILSAKYDVGLEKYDPISEYNLRKDLFEPAALGLKNRLVEEALTLVSNESDLIPLKDLSDKKVAVLSLGVSGKMPFQAMVQKYTKAEAIQVPHGALDASWVNKLKQYDVVIVGVHKMSKYAQRNYGLKDSDMTYLRQLQSTTPVVVNIFGSPYALQKFDGFNHVVVGYEYDAPAQEVAAEALFGVFPYKGKLPVSISDEWSAGHGLTTNDLFRLGHAYPERMGMSSDSLAYIDSLLEEIIRVKAAPGGQVAVVKNGRMVYSKAFGHHTYNNKQSVRITDLYDLASLTKILSTTLAVMHLNDAGRISVFSPIGLYLPELKGSNKEELIIEDILTHTAGLKPWIPFYRETLTESRYPRPSKDWYGKDSIPPFVFHVAKDMYMHEDYVDSVWTKIITSDLRDNRDYRYSDLGFYLMARLVERVSGMPLNEYVDTHFYKPMGLQRTTYLPLKNHDESNITPSERDDYYRFQDLRGYVHDMGAAMMGGVAGHAGLFSTAEDVAVIMQMLLNGGYYGGRRYLSPTAVALFTARPLKETRRGLGFDMKQLDPHISPNMSGLASFRTFGHLGFTGTCAWADPTHNLIFVFLSNRTYPTMNNNKLGREDYRIKLHATAYKAIINQDPG